MAAFRDGDDGAEGVFDESADVGARACCRGEDTDDEVRDSETIIGGSNRASRLFVMRVRESVSVRIGPD